VTETTAAYASKHARGCVRRASGLVLTLIPYMSHPVRQMLYWRRLDYSWKHIANRLSLTEKQAKSRFYYGAHQAYEELQRVQAMRACERDQRNGNEGSR
jgi:hypothetical protein